MSHLYCNVLKTGFLKRDWSNRYLVVLFLNYWLDSKMPLLIMTATETLPLMDKLIQVIYVSSAVKLMAEPELEAMLETAKAANDRHHISGLLLYKDGNFMQAIEGEATAVNQLLSNIQLDQRHTGFIELLRESIEEREFPHWAMGYRNLNGHFIEGFSDFFFCDKSLDEQKILPGKAKRLVLSFRGC